MNYQIARTFGKNAILTLTDRSNLVILINKLLLTGIKKDPEYILLLLKIYSDDIIGFCWVIKIKIIKQNDIMQSSYWE